MAVTFQSKSQTPITLLNEDAQNLLKIIGHSGTVPSALRAEDIPAALELIELAIQNDCQDASDNNSEDVVINLKNRITPIIHLFNAAQEEGEIVMWR